MKWWLLSVQLEQLRIPLKIEVIYAVQGYLNEICKSQAKIKTKAPDSKSQGLFLCLEINDENEKWTQWGTQVTPLNENDDERRPEKSMVVESITGTKENDKTCSHQKIEKMAKGWTETDDKWIKENRRMDLRYFEWLKKRGGAWSGRKPLITAGRKPYAGSNPVCPTFKCFVGSLTSE